MVGKVVHKFSCFAAASFKFAFSHSWFSLCQRLIIVQLIQTERAQNSLNKTSLFFLLCQAEWKFIFTFFRNKKKTLNSDSSSAILLLVGWMTEMFCT